MMKLAGATLLALVAVAALVRERDEPAPAAPTVARVTIATTPARLRAPVIAAPAARPVEPAKAARAEAPPAMSSTIVEGLVVDEQLRPLAGARVVAGERETVSGADGSFRLEVAAAAPFTVVARVGTSAGAATFEGALASPIVVVPERRLRVRIVDERGIGAAAVVRVAVDGEAGRAESSLATTPCGRLDLGVADGSTVALDVDAGGGGVHRDVVVDDDADLTIVATRGVREPPAGYR